MSNSTRVRAVIDEAAKAGSPTELVAVLDRECADDFELRRRVMSQLNGDPGESAATAQIGPPIDGNDAELSILEPTTKPGALGRLGHYEILEMLGRGGFGIVLKAFDEVLHRVVAIKVMTTEMAATSPARKRFLREARAAAAVRHENVVQIYAVEERPVPYLVMEYIPGRTLQGRLDASGPLDARSVAQFGYQIARGMAAAHEMGLVHRDIKPGNILIESGPEPRAKLTDFGLARAADDASLTQSGLVAGTPMYMAPEQARGDTLDHRTDLFSLGSVLYVMASGRPPFRASNTLAVLKRVDEDIPRPIQEIIPETPEWLCDIIAKLHHKNPDDRYQSARQLADVLADCLNQIQLHGKVIDRTRINGGNSPRVRATSRSRLIASGLALAILITLGATLAGRLITGKPIFATEAFVNSPRFTNALGMDFVLVGKGIFTMGGSGGKSGTRPVIIPHDFYLGMYEVTQGEWERLMGRENNPSHFSRTGSEGVEVAEITDEDLKRFPVDSVSWNQCQEFISRLNAEVHEPGWFYRLPTSAEWEYACRGGPLQTRDDDGFDFYFDQPTNMPSPDKANTKIAELRRTQKVGSYPPNRLGLYDMHGNVFEYCNDVVQEGSDNLRIIRGGGRFDDEQLCRASHTCRGSASAAYAGAGLRLARVPRGSDN